MSVPITPGTGVNSVAAEVISGLQYQQVKIVSGATSSTTGLNVNSDGSIGVSVIGTFPVTATITGTPSISGAVTIVGNPSISGSVNVPNTVSVAGATQLAGASPGSIMTVTRIDNQIVGSMLGMVGQVVIHGLTSAGGGSYVDVKVDPSGALVTASSSVVAFQGGTRITSVSGVVNASIVGGTVSITPASVSGTVGASVLGTVPVVQSGAWTTSVVGGPVTLYASPSSFTSGVTSVVTDTNSVLVLKAPGGGMRNYVTHVIATNAAAAGTFVDIVDSGRIIYSGYAAASGGGFSATLPTPLQQPSITTALYAAARTQASIIVAMSGFTGA